MGAVGGHKSWVEREPGNVWEVKGRQGAWIAEVFITGKGGQTGGSVVPAHATHVFKPGTASKEGSQGKLCGERKLSLHQLRKRRHIGSKGP
eukprot:1161173-Pelagomonas_calceolata.AAC.4